MMKPPLVDPLKPNARVADPGTAHHLDGNNNKKKPRILPLVIALLIAAALAYFVISMLTADNEVSVIGSDIPLEVTTDPDITDDTATATDPIPAATATEPETQTVVGEGATAWAPT